MLLAFFKSHIKGFTRKDGTFVPPHDNKVVAKGPAPKALFDPKAPLPDDAYAKVGKPVEVPPAKAPKAMSVKPKSAAHLEALAAAKVGTYKPPYKGESKPPKAHQFHQGALWGHGEAKQPKFYPSAKPHPQLHDDGKPFIINEPSKPSSPETWEDAGMVAVFVPKGHAPAELNGVPFAPWRDAPRSIEEWESVPGQKDGLELPELVLPPKKDASAGVIIEEPDGRVWLIDPSNQFGGYKTTFPKGRIEDGLNPQASAIKEAFEESGLQVEITGYVGDVERTQTVTRYFTAKRVGGTPTDMGWESQSVRLVPKNAVYKFADKSVDQQVAELAGYRNKQKT